MSNSKKIAIMGASGYVGTALLDKLQNSKYQVVALSRHIEQSPIESENITKVNCDVFDEIKLIEQLQEADTAIYLLHMMSQKAEDYAVAETRAAKIFAMAAKQAGVKKIIYLGGLGNDSDNLSKHLRSRHHTGEVMRSIHPKVIEFRASMIIGDGSISYDIITNLVHKVPTLTLPSWAKTMTQPIGLDDMISYLVSAIELKSDGHEIIEVGGPEQLSYEELFVLYTKFKNKKRLIIHFPVIPTSIAAWWLNLFTPKRHAKVGRAMVESLGNPMIVTNNKANELFPDIKPQKLDQTFV